ncbi:MAG: DUF1592 domain-containing protein [Pirellulales bacterium]|nr:DUF1592 domain-containing protein [Pirellulales bacterium]
MQTLLVIVEHQRAAIRLGWRACLTLLLANSISLAETPKGNPFTEVVVPFLNNHCTDCHSGDEAEAQLALDGYRQSAKVQTDYEIWERVQRMLVERQMPPSDHPQPTQAETLACIEAIEAVLESFDCRAAEHPGRVTIRRLNRVEYNNTIRDLIGLDLQLAGDFPSDDVGDGFDNIGDVLSISPILMEKYVAAAKTIAEEAFKDEAARKRILVHQAESDAEKVAAARKNIRMFASRAYRRPVDESELNRLFEVMVFAWQQGSEPDEIFKTAVTAVLASPQFLFRIELDPEADDEDGIRPLNDYELASRLSYFLWSSMPDRELFDLAAQEKLTDPQVLAGQVKRMLADPKARALVDNFAGQWLQLRDVDVIHPDPDQFKDFDDQLRVAMRRETELFFETVMREDHSILEFLDADFTFVNQRLARHYQMPDIEGDEFRRVSLQSKRRGILTHASILMLTSNPTRTSPVKRGKWILDNILGQAPPPPPPDVPELGDDAETFGSLREQMQQHRSNESCAVCHRKMDTLGFGLENFDAIGAWREKDGRFEIDPSGDLPGGRSFRDAAELMTILAEEKKAEFCRCLTQKMLTYALGRGLNSYDRCTVKEIVQALEENDYRFTTLVTKIVTSPPFMMREAAREE